MNSSDLSLTLTKSHKTHDLDMCIWQRIFFVSREHSKVNYEKIMKKLASWRHLKRVSESYFRSSLKIEGIQTHGTNLHFLPQPKPHSHQFSFTLKTLN